MADRADGKRKRGRGRGQLTPRKGGGFTWRMFLGRDEHGNKEYVRETIPVVTKTEAEEYVTIRLAERASGTYVRPSTEMVGQVSVQVPLSEGQPASLPSRP
jgi:hypothetical protein